eukprot:UN21400
MFGLLVCLTAPSFYSGLISLGFPYKRESKNIWNGFLELYLYKNQKHLGDAYRLFNNQAITAIGKDNVKNVHKIFYGSMDDESYEMLYYPNSKIQNCVYDR